MLKSFRKAPVGGSRYVLKTILGGVVNTGECQKHSKTKITSWVKGRSIWGGVASRVHKLSNLKNVNVFEELLSQNRSKRSTGMAIR